MLRFATQQNNGSPSSPALAKRYALFPPPHHNSSLSRERESEREQGYQKQRRGREREGGCEKSVCPLFFFYLAPAPSSHPNLAVVAACVLSKPTTTRVIFPFSDGRPPTAGCRPTPRCSPHLPQARQIRSLLVAFGGEGRNDLVAAAAGRVEGMVNEALEERWLEEQTRIARAVVDTDDVLWTLDQQPSEEDAATAPRPTPPPQDGQAQTEPEEISSGVGGGTTISGGGGGGGCGSGDGSRDGVPPESPPPPAIVPGATPSQLLRLVGGVDISFVKGSEENACASLVVLEFPSLQTVYEAYERVTMNHPYMSGFLAFREVDHLARLVGQLRRERPDLEPDVVFVDGNGRLHPRGAGLACHLGVVTGLRTVGLGKTFLQVDGLTKIGVRERVRALLSAGERETPLLGTSGTVWGTALVPKEEEGKKGGGVVTSPVFVSIGHRVSLETCVALTKAVCRFRVPEPIRQADMRSREVIREWLLERRGKAEAETKEGDKGPPPPPPQPPSLP